MFSIDCIGHTLRGYIKTDYKKYPQSQLGSYYHQSESRPLQQHETVSLLTMYCQTTFAKMSPDSSYGLYKYRFQAIGFKTFILKIGCKLKVIRMCMSAEMSISGVPHIWL